MIIYVKIIEKNFKNFNAYFMLIYVQKVIYGRSTQNYSSEPHKTDSNFFQYKL
jgi:hypothetical protein